MRTNIGPRYQREWPASGRTDTGNRQGERGQTGDVSDKQLQRTHENANLNKGGNV